MRKYILSVLSIFFVSFCVQPNVIAQITDYGDLDTSKFPPQGWKEQVWWDPGGWTTVNVTTAGLPKNSPTTDAAIEFASIIAANPGRTRFYFPAGTYYFKTNLEVDRGDIWIDGDGSSTIFRLDAPTSQKLEIKFFGSEGTPVNVTSAISRGDNVISVSSTAGLAKNDTVKVYMTANTGLKDNYNAGQISVIDANPSGGTVTLREKMGIGITSSQQPKLLKYSTANNIKIQDIKIERVRDNADFSNNLTFIRTKNVWIDNVESQRSANHHISFAQSYKFIITGSDLHVVCDNGVGGLGYVIISHGDASVGFIAYNTFTNLRHHVLTQRGANHLVVAYNTASGYTGTDNPFVTHGRGSHNNLFEGNLSSANGDALIDGVHGAELGYNTFFRNRSQDIGDDSNSADKTNVIGNEYTGALKNRGGGNYVGGNKKDGGSVVWNDLPTNADIPPSLYTTSQPSYVSSWPLYGPTGSAGGTSWKYIESKGDFSRLEGTVTNNAQISSSTATGNRVEWEFVGAGGGYEYIQLRENGKRLQGRGWGSGDDDAVIVDSSNTGDWVKWKKVDAGGGDFFLEVKGDGSRLQGRGWGGGDDNAVIVAPSNSGDWVKWRITDAP